MEFWLRYALALLTIAVLLAALSAIARTLQRTRARRGARRLEILETLPLAPQAALHVVRVGSREMLVGTGRVRVLVRELVD